jgi:SAM-dependent methyltransferase
MSILDSGAGTGRLCKLLSRLDGLSISALEPSPAMARSLKAKAGLEGVDVFCGFCDAEGDRMHYEESQFDVVVSRQLVNGLFDPMTAFRNWKLWLAPGGAVVLIDVFYSRSSWSGRWEDHVDELPLSACQSIAMSPYLLELAGYRVEVVEKMTAANKMSSTQTTRYVVVARRPA